MSFSQRRTDFPLYRFVSMPIYTRAHDQPIVLKVAVGTDMYLWFRLKRSTPLGLLMRRTKTQLALPRETRFIFDGQTVRKDSTPMTVRQPPCLPDHDTYIIDRCPRCALRCKWRTKTSSTSCSSASVAEASCIML